MGAYRLAGLWQVELESRSGLVVCGIIVDIDGKVYQTCPFLRRFIGQDFDNLLNWDPVVSTVHIDHRATLPKEYR